MTGKNRGADTLEKVMTDREKKIKALTDVVTKMMDVSAFVKIKNALNEVFGEENNQLVSPFEHEQFEQLAQTLNIKEDNPKTRDNIRMHFKSYYVGAVVYIRFPEITIKNSKGKSRKIYDLFVRFAIDIDGRLLSTPAGTVATYDEESLFAQYRHSHLNAGVRQDFTGFCMGSDTPLAMLSQKLRVDPFTEGSFKHYLYTIREYVKWESVEGGPYYRMETIQGNRNGTHWLAMQYTEKELFDAKPGANWTNAQYLYPNDPDFYVSLVKGKFIDDYNASSDAEKEHIINTFFTYKLIGNDIILTPTVEFSKYLANTFLQIFNTYFSSTGSFKQAYSKYCPNRSKRFHDFQIDMAHRLVFIKSSTGRYLVSPAIYKKATGSTIPKSDSQVEKLIGKPIFKFKGEQIKIKLIVPENVEKETIDENSFYVHPKILNDVTTYFNNQVNSTLLITCSSTRESSNDNIRKTTEADILVMLQD